MASTCRQCVPRRIELIAAIADYVRELRARSSARRRLAARCRQAAAAWPWHASSEQVICR